MGVVKPENRNSLANLSFLIEDMLDGRITADDVRKFILGRVIATLNSPPVETLHSIKKGMHDLEVLISETVLSILGDEKILEELQNKQKGLIRTGKRYKDDSEKVYVRQLSPSEAGKMLGMSKQGIIKKINAGTIKASKIGDRYKIPLSEVDRLLSKKAKSG